MDAYASDSGGLVLVQRCRRDEVVLRVFDPLGNKHWKAWDWQDGRLMLYAIAEYQGEWYGPLEVPK